MTPLKMNIEHYSNHISFVQQQQICKMLSKSIGYLRRCFRVCLVYARNFTLCLYLVLKLVMIVCGERASM